MGGADGLTGFSPETYPFPTLPDLLRPGLNVVFVGINPSLLSVARGHYFARSTSRFWPAFSRSRLSEPLRASLGRDTFGPADDALLFEAGFGFTDVVKTPSSNASTITAKDYAEWAPQLLTRLEAVSPEVICFHGITGYRAFARYALNEPRKAAPMGLLERALGSSRLFLAPNPSPANAHYQVVDQTRFYDDLSDVLKTLRAKTTG